MRVVTWGSRIGLFCLVGGGILVFGIGIPLQVYNLVWGKIVSIDNEVIPPGDFISRNVSGLEENTYLRIYVSREPNPGFGDKIPVDVIFGRVSDDCLKMTTLCTSESYASNPITMYVHTGSKGSDYVLYIVNKSDIPVEILSDISHGVVFPPLTLPLGFILLIVGLFLKRFFTFGRRQLPFEPK